MTRSKKHPLLFFLFAAAALGAEETWELPFSAGEFDVDIYQFPYMLLIDNYESEDIDTVYTFTDEAGNFELRYSFFAHQSGQYAENIRRSFALFAISLINGAAGFEVDLHEVELYDSGAVAGEYNGDIGVSVFIPHPASEYGAGREFMLLSFFFKEYQGIVMQTILFDDIEFAGTEEFMGLSHSFRFHE